MKVRFTNPESRSAAARGPGLLTPVARGERGIALVITLIMLAVTLVMAVAFLALARRERGSVSTSTDTTVARLAAETAVANAQAQIVANILGGYNAAFGTNALAVSSNAYNLRLLVSTNYLNYNYGFQPGIASPTNVFYADATGHQLTGNNLIQNIANLWYLPRVPVFVPTNPPNASGYDFRYYLDLNENGRYDTNGWQNNLDANGQVLLDAKGNPLVTVQQGDPEWIGVLEHPDMPHGPNNHFISRYAFVALPVGNTMDINYIHNQVNNQVFSTSDGYMRNQGVGSWEINLAAFLADLNTNIWSPRALPNSAYYAYNQPGLANSGTAFDDARALLAYRYNGFPPVFPAGNSFFNAGGVFPTHGIDAYGDGPLQTTLDTNETLVAGGGDGDKTPNSKPWPGSDNPNHFFTASDFYDQSKSSLNFVNRLKNAGNQTDTYDRYTYYRLLNELGSDSTPDIGKINLNYSNAAVKYFGNGYGSGPVASIGIIPGAETNLMRWRPLDFFTAASDQMLRTYSSYWYNENRAAFTNTFAVDAPFSITNIPVLVSNRFVYTPAVNRLLQLAANLYDATTNDNPNLPHVFRPIFACANNPNHDVYIVGYLPVTFVSGTGDRQLSPPYDITQLHMVPQVYGQPIRVGGSYVNVFGVPWIIGAKKGLPNFNELFVNNVVVASRKLEAVRGKSNGTPTQTNQMYVFSIGSNLGLSFWNSYSAKYPRRLTIYANDQISMCMTNALGKVWPPGQPAFANYVWNSVIPAWPGANWSGVPPSGTANSGSFIYTNWTYSFMPQAVYRFGLGTGQFVSDPYALNSWETTTTLAPLPQLGLTTTNYLQAYILDGNNVIDYVQINGPTDTRQITQELADNATSGQGMWNTNRSGGGTGWGLINQISVSESGRVAPPESLNNWINPPGSPGGTIADQAAYFRDFMTDPRTKIQQTTLQAPYTPSREVYEISDYQANDPLVHYLKADLNNLNPGTYGFQRNDDPLGTSIPTPDFTAPGSRYQPWGISKQMAGLGGVDVNAYNLAYKDPLMWDPDYWDFPTNIYPSVGWVGRVHRGTPWQTVYLKSTNILNLAGARSGLTTWVDWTGNFQTNLYGYYDAVNNAPQQDYLLFDIFNAGLNENATRGGVPVNVGAGQLDGGLAAWSALFSGMVGLSNSAPIANSSTPLQYTSLLVNPVGVDWMDSPLWRIVNDPTNGINATRTNTLWFPAQTFSHVGQILATPALSTHSPFLNLTGTQTTNGINDEMYEWLPQQMMGLVRPTQQRYVLYCFGQTLHPAPNGTVLSGPYFQMVTNYQVVAESALRVVMRVDDANTSHPHAVVESYNVLPPN
jgi:hypothetical protein